MGIEDPPPPESDPQFRRFQIQYLVVYGVMMGADWVQGPYQYALYEYYKYDKGTIGHLFIAGFGASAICGTFAGSMADKYGRKFNCALYALLYGLSCVTKHYSDFRMLLLGRILGGTATSILFSAFESWMVAEHHNRQYHPAWIDATFSYMHITNFGVAIAGGFLGHAGVTMSGTPVAAFDLSLGCCLVGGLMVCTQWQENYGAVAADFLPSIQSAMIKVVTQKKLLLLGMIQSLFEAAMYSFVFMWTPALEQAGDIPHGIIFGCFMIASAFGGWLYGPLSRKFAVERMLRYVFIVACLSMAAPIITTHTPSLIFSFCVFEGCLGVFWPAMGTLRSRFVPEEERATIMNLFRVPLNVLVCVLLLKVGSMALSTVFAFTCICHALCFVAQTMLLRDINTTPRCNSLTLTPQRPTTPPPNAISPTANVSVPQPDIV